MSKPTVPGVTSSGKALRGAEGSVAPLPIPHCEMKLGNVLSMTAPIATQEVWFPAAAGPKVAGENKGRMNEIYAAKNGKSDIDWF